MDKGTAIVMYLLPNNLSKPKVGNIAFVLSKPKVYGEAGCFTLANKVFVPYKIIQFNMMPEMTSFTFW